jgi:hypothetical protein
LISPSPGPRIRISPAANPAIATARAAAPAPAFHSMPVTQPPASAVPAPNASPPLSWATGSSAGPPAAALRSSADVGGDQQREQEQLRGDGDRERAQQRRAPLERRAPQRAVEAQSAARHHRTGGEPRREAEQRVAHVRRYRWSEAAPLVLHALPSIEPDVDPRVVAPRTAVDVVAGEVLGRNRVVADAAGEHVAAAAGLPTARRGRVDQWVVGARALHDVVAAAPAR